MSIPFINMEVQMIITLTINKKKYSASYKGITARLYREAFRKDLILELNEMQKRIFDVIIKSNKDNFTEEDALNNIIVGAGTEALFKLLWASVQGEQLLQNKEPLPSFQRWTDESDYNDILAASLSVYNMMVYSGQSVATSESKEAKNTSKKKR